MTNASTRAFGLTMLGAVHLVGRVASMRPNAGVRSWACPPPPSARLFLSAGVLEEQDAPAYLPVSNVRRLAGHLLDRKFPGFQVMCHIFPDETHASVVPATISRGLRMLFSKNA